MKAIFLDRDGCVNECRGSRVGFVNSPDDLLLNEGVSEDITQLREMGYRIFIVTNQGGVGLGYMKRETLDEIHERLRGMIEVDDVAVCDHRPDEGCDCRKPEPGMILALAEEHRIDLANSWMVGDRESDVLAGKNAGCHTFLVEENKGIGEFVKHLKNLK